MAKMPCFLSFGPLFKRAVKLPEVVLLPVLEADIATNPGTELYYTMF